jgi:anti-anti-sigma factor
MKPIDDRPASFAGVHLSDGLVSEMGRSDSRLRVVVERSDAAVLFCAGGSVDASNAGLWRRLVGEAARVTVAPGPLIVDASQLEFMGACAFSVLAEESARCRRRGISLVLVSHQCIVARVIAATGLETELPLYPSIRAALSNDPSLAVTTTAARQSVAS